MAGLLKLRPGETFHDVTGETLYYCGNGTATIVALPQGCLPTTVSWAGQFNTTPETSWSWSD